jgi:hypothetical protein
MISQDKENLLAGTIQNFRGTIAEGVLPKSTKDDSWIIEEDGSLLLCIKDTEGNEPDCFVKIEATTLESLYREKEALRSSIQEDAENEELWRQYDAVIKCITEWELKRDAGFINVELEKFFPNVPLIGKIVVDKQVNTRPNDK